MKSKPTAIKCISNPDGKRMGFTKTAVASLQQINLREKTRVRFTYMWKEQDLKCSSVKHLLFL